MPSIGPLELIAIAVVALIVFGPEKLPDVARTVGKTLGEVRKVASDMRSEFQEGMSIEDDKEVPPEAGSRVGRAPAADQEGRPEPEPPVEKARVADSEISRVPPQGPPEISNKPDAGPVGPGAGADDPDQT